MCIPSIDKYNDNFNEFNRLSVRTSGVVEVPKLKQKAFGTPFRLTRLSDTRVTNGHYMEHGIRAHCGNPFISRIKIIIN